MNYNQGSYKAQFELDIPPSPSGLAKEHCRANRAQIEKIRRHRDEQVRIEFPKANGTTSAIYTVTTFHNDDTDLVFLGGKIQNQLRNCQLSNTDTCEGEVKAQVTIKGLDDKEAEERGEFIEHLSHDDQNHSLGVIAPHGGEIEPWTDKQAEYVRNHIFHLSVYLYGYVRVLVAKTMTMHLSIGILHLLNLTKNHFPSLTRFLDRILNIPLPFMGGRKIPFVSEEARKVRTMV